MAARKPRVSQDWSARQEEPARPHIQCAHDPMCLWPGVLEADSPAGAIRVCVRHYDDARQHERMRRWERAGRPVGTETARKLRGQYRELLHIAEGGVWNVSRADAIEHWHVVLARFEAGSFSHDCARVALKNLGAKIE